MTGIGIDFQEKSFAAIWLSSSSLSSLPQEMTLAESKFGTSFDSSFNV